MYCLFIGTSLNKEHGLCWWLIRSVSCGGDYKASTIMSTENFVLPCGI